MSDVSSETPLDRLTTYITPNEAFFVRHHSPAEAPDPDGWSLAVEGEVTRPFRLSLDELKRLPPTTVTCVLECAGNGRSLYQPSVQGLSWGRGAVGNARWTGVRVAALLEKAGVKRGARHLHTAGTDEPSAGEAPFLRSVELEKALADAIVAWEMNGEPLPALHGAPARLVVPGWAGDHWMKWLARLAPQAGERTGWFMDEEYRYPVRPGRPGEAIPSSEMLPITDLVVKSSITAAPSAARVGSAVPVSGFAFSGAPDVVKVEISDDEGSTWSAADLDPRHDPYAWRLWSILWTPRRPGQTRLYARATDSRGSVQPREAVWNPGGFLHNGWQPVEIDVSSR